MSFILDQLKKSGKKRQLELAMRSKAETPGRQAAEAARTDFQPTSDHRIHTRGIYLLLLLAAASFSALGGYIVLHGNPWSRQSPVKAQVHTAAPSVPKVESTIQESVFPVDGETSIPTKSPSESGPEKEMPARAVVREMPDGKVKSSMPTAVAEHQNQPGSTIQEQIANPSPPEKSEPEDNANRMPYLNELSGSLKNALPPIHITSHLYRGDSRLVSINGKIMSEGVNVGEGLFLDEITPEGVVLSFHGHRFRVRAD